MDDLLILLRLFLHFFELSLDVGHVTLSIFEAVTRLLKLCLEERVGIGKLLQLQCALTLKLLINDDLLIELEFRFLEVL